MKTAKEIVDIINAAKLKNPHYVEDEIDVDGDGITNITTINQDEHRWYVLGTVVYSIGNEFFGVRGPVSLKSESMSWEDVGVDCEAFEMIALPSVTYKRKRIVKDNDKSVSREVLL